MEQILCIIAIAIFSINTILSIIVIYNQRVLTKTIYYKGYKDGMTKGFTDGITYEHKPVINSVDYVSAEQLVKDKQYGIARNKEGIITGCEHYEPEEVLANHFKKISICAKCRHKGKCEIIANDIKTQ